MPDFIFYIDEIDRDIILKTLLDEADLRIIPNINHSTAFPESFKSVTPELIRCLELNPRCYISGSFSLLPPQTMKMEKGTYAGTYVVAQNKGGPLLILSLLTRPIESVCGRLAPSHLTYSKSTWNEQLTDLVPPSEALKAGFKQVRKILKNACVKLEGSNSVWIGRSAAKRFEVGNVPLLVDGVVVGKQK